MLRTDTTLSVDERNAQLAQLLTDTQARITNVLGRRGYEAYRRIPGSWLAQATKSVR